MSVGKSPCVKSLTHLGTDPLALRNRYVLDHSGKKTLKMVPVPSLLSTSILPPCASTIDLVIDNPSPAPPVRLARETSAR